MSKILFVGGTWNLKGGKSSSIVNLFAKYLQNADVYNGGSYNDLNKILESCKDYDIVLWWANVPNDLPKIRNVKDINYKTMLVSSKNNADNKYSFQELLQKSLSMKSNLTIEFTKKDKLYNMRLFDPLGNVWYEGVNIKECAKALTERLIFLNNITRKSTILDEENTEIVDYFYKAFKDDINSSIEFLNIVKDYATKFKEVMFNTKDVKRFLGNASFRCSKGFPSFRYRNYIFVSKRNVNKEYISIDEFVPVYTKDNKIYYCGKNKPSVDTPIQVKLYEKLPNINYMIHSHCYIKNAPFTLKPLPCGALEETDEILTLIEKYYDNNYNKDFYIINLKGHGSIMMSKSVEKLKDIEMIRRNVPEKKY